jgi:ribulose kinase
MCAAVGAGWHATAAEAAEAMSDKTLRDLQPSIPNWGRYTELLEIYREFYRNLCGAFSELVHFRDGQ